MTNVRKQFFYLVSAMSIAVCGNAHAVDTPAPAAATSRAPIQISQIPDKWQKYFDIRIEPARTVYFGGNKAISHDPKNPRSDHAHFIVWGKFVYAKPQKLGDKSFVTELVGVHIDCAKDTYSQFRDIKLDTDDKVVQDLSTVTKFLPIPMNAPNLGELSAAPATADGALEFTCGMDED